MMSYKKINTIKYIIYILIFLTSACHSRKIQQKQDISSDIKKTTEESRLSQKNVAILMPTTGQYNGLGTQLTCLIQSGLNNYKDSIEIKTQIFNVHDHDSANKAIDEIISAKQKFDLILGPIFSSSVQPIETKLRELNLTVITLSNTKSIAHDNIYTFGYAPMSQTDQILNHFVNLHHKDIIVLLPNDDQYADISHFFYKTASRLKMNTPMIHSYNSNEDIAKYVSKIETLVSNINESADIDQLPLMYISGSKSDLLQIFDQIKKQNLDQKVKIIGDNRIMSDALDHIGVRKYYTGSLLYHKNKSEVLELIKSCNVDIEQDSMSILAYDLGRFAAQLLNSADSSDELLENINKKLYNGFSGDIIFQNNIAIRKYDIIKND